MKLNTRSNYVRMTKQARVFVEVLSGDVGFADPEVNRVALESMLVGWMAGTPQFRAFAEYLGLEFRRDNPFIHAQDLAVQVAEDLVARDSRFAWRRGGKR